MAEETSEAATKACPACGETILAVAKKCKHCGEWIGEEARAATPPAQTETPQANAPPPATALRPPSLVRTTLFFWLGSLVGLSIWLFLTVAVMRRLNDASVTDLPIGPFIVGLLIVSAVASAGPGVVYGLLLADARRGRFSEPRLVVIFLLVYGTILSVGGYFAANFAADYYGGYIREAPLFVIGTLIAALGAVLVGRGQWAAIAKLDLPAARAATKQPSPPGDGANASGPSTSLRSQASPAPPRACPNCGKTINAAATTCGHCWTRLGTVD